MGREAAGSRRLPAPLRYFTPVPQSSAFDSHSWRPAGSPRFLGNPSREHALLFDPGGPDASGHCDTPDIAFRAPDGVGSAIGHISRLNHTAYSLAVYASRLGLLRFEHRARLASHWRPTLLGQDSHLLGCIRRFPLCVFHSHRFPLLEAFPGAPTAVTPSRWRCSRQLGCRAEAGPCQLHTKVRRRFVCRLSSAKLHRCG